MPPKVSIITVVRNDRNGLARTLAALTAIDYPSVEIVVIDGASTDGTQDVIARYADRIGYSVSEPDGGLYDAMNKGMAAATGDYLWFINAGDEPFSPETLSRVFASGDRAADADIYFGETVVVDPSGLVLGLRKKRLPEKLTAASMKKGMVVCHQSFIVKRSIAPYYDTQLRYVADIDWVIKCLDRAAAVNTHIVLSRFETGGISTRHRRAGLKERWHLMRRRYGLFTTVLAHLGFALDAFRPPYRKYGN